MIRSSGERHRSDVLSATKRSGFPCTILLATYNRPQMLAQQLRYLDQSNFGGPVRIFDSSDSEIAKRNAAVTAAYPAFAYSHLPPSTPVFTKFATALSDSSTPYSVLLPDDDFLLVERLPDILAALEADSDAVAAHGHYFEYHLVGRRVNMTGLIQCGAHLVQPRSADRVVALMPGYEALTYAVCRTAPARIAFAEAAKQESILAQELLAGAAVAALGKVLRLGFLSHGRRAGSSLGYRQWHPMEWASVDPAGLITSYGPYRTALLGIVQSREPGLNMEKAARSIDLAHLAYLSRYLDADVLTDAASRDIDVEGTDAVAEAAWDVWAAKRGPAWLKPLRTGNWVSRGLRRMLRKSGLRYRMPVPTSSDGKVFDTGRSVDVSIVPAVLQNPVFKRSILDTDADLGRLAQALSLRESTTKELAR